MIASAITSKYARNVKQTKSSGGLQYLVVLALGIGRMVTIKMLGYQVYMHTMLFTTLGSPLLPYDRNMYLSMEPHGIFL